MKYSRLFGKSVREAKSDMKSVSHQLLYKAGFVRELSAGRYEMMPLGFMVWERVVDIIDKEMKRIGSQRISIPILQPIEIWQKSNRDKAWGSSLMRIKDSRGAEFALSATGEGVITEMVSDTRPSYKDLPIIVHQFIAKFRDETRVRGGLLRVREFEMKDAYSYHASEEDFMKTYQDFYEAYSNICKKLNLEFYPVIADSGALGGDYCHEFQVPCEAGEDHIVKCSGCDYAANTEKAEFIREDINLDEELKNMDIVDLPEHVKTIEDLVKHYNMPANRFLKNVVYKSSDGKLIIATIVGNLDVNEKKLSSIIGRGDLEVAEDADLEMIGSKPGYVHSWGYEEFRDKVIFVVDESVTKARNLYGGFKTETKDPINVNYGRDFDSDIIGDIAEAPDASKCKKCGGDLKLIRTIEFGHIFKYDHFYTKHHDGYFVDADGQEKLMYMGAYGIGIGRAIATIVEKNHDDKGVIWPMSVAPFQVHIVSLGGSEALGASEDLYKKLTQLGVDVLWDDREDCSAGVKFSDADLLGMPIRVIISDKSMKAGGAEVKLRSEGEARVVGLGELIKVVSDIIE